ncbi:MAG: UvrD-helicase domain-containing protein [Candidatus Omnitrophica bacterium]|nr:UvrD-helicase domain-containing protein [Candidatus Omnitrophota bacterium]MCM8793953.1 UvrD-helicase domain-containing protein [Candidatus Omnitrophota bacterium]
MKVFSQVHIIEASAGSGKTRCLAKKYLSLLLNPQLNTHIPHILAITFTNKAAGEMKERVLEFLKRIALDIFRDENEKEELLSDLGEKETLQNKAQQTIEEIIRNYNFFQIQTIDSFINTLLYGCAYRLGLSVNFKIERYTYPYLNYGLDRLIEKAHSEKEVLRFFRSFIQHYLFIENKTGWFPKESILRRISELFSLYNKYPGQFIPNEIEIKDLILKKRQVSKKIRMLFKQLPPSTHKKFVHSLKNFLDTHLHKDNFDISEVSSYFQQENFPVTKGGFVSAQTINLWNKIRRSLREICETESALIFNAYISIFNKTLDETLNFLRKENVLFLEALNKEAYTLFRGKEMELPELYYRLSLRLKHFLIDEFQDTSRLQWNNLLEMINDGLSRGGSFFSVGDKKQAIYRFRGGEVSLFEEIESYFKNYKKEKGLLKKNYRSRKEIVEFNNFIFSEENLRRFLAEENLFEKEGMELSGDDIERIIKVFKDSKQEPLKNGGYIKIDLFSCADKEEHNEILKDKLISLIRTLQNRFSPKGMAILARKNVEVELFTNWLLAENIPVESEKTLNIRENPYIKEILSFLKFLSHPVDNLSFASFILGDIFCKKTKIEKDKLQDFIFNFRFKKGSPHLYHEFRKEFSSFWDKFIEEFFKCVGFVPLYELLITFLEKFSVLDNFPEHLGFLMKFLEVIKEYEEEYSDISSFLEFFENISPEELYVNVTKTDAVKIMTIHKAKGLDFPVVIIPSLEMVLESPSQFIVKEEDKLRLLYLRKIYNHYSPHLSRLYREEYISSFIDELNNLYVALTRAEDELYIFSAVSIGRRKNPASSLLPYHKQEYGKPDIYLTEKEEISPVLEVPAGQYKNWIEVLKDEFIDKTVLRDKESIVYGEVIHAVLSHIGNLYYREKSSLLTEAIEKVKVNFPYFDKYEEIRKTITTLLEKEEFKEFFSLAEGSLFQELELVDRFGNTQRIDRLIVKEDSVWLIDYKTGKERKDEDIEQVKTYLSILCEIYPGRELKGFLIYLDDYSLNVVYE